MARLLLFLLLFSIYSVYGNRYQTYNGYGKGYGKGYGNGYGKDYGDHDKGYGDYGPYGSGYKPPAKTYGFKVPSAFLKSNPYSYLFSKSSSTKDYDSPSETSLLSSAYKSKSMPSGKYSGKRYRTYGKRPSFYPYNREEPEGKPHRDTDDYGKHPYRKSYFNRLEARPERRQDPRPERRPEPRPDRPEDRPEPTYTKTTSRGKTSHYPRSPYDEAAPGRASYFPRSHFPDFDRKQVEKAKMLRGMKKIYGQSAPRKTVFFRQGDRTFRSRGKNLYILPEKFVKYSTSFWLLCV